jgi:hypothetical protein
MKKRLQMNIMKTLVMLLMISIVLISPTEAGNGDGPTQGGPEPLGGTLGESLSYGDYIEIVGDGHIHSSRGGASSSVHDIALKAQERGLDWIFITDWDTIAAKQDCIDETNETFICGLGEEVQAREGSPPEVTNEIIAWGIDTVVSGQTNPNYTVGDIIDEIHRQGGLAYLPHPMAPDEDDDYNYFGVYDDFDAMSIYHGYGGFNNLFPSTMDEQALLKWDEYLNDGFRKTALGESDCKNANNVFDPTDFTIGAIGYPRNYIYAREFSVRGIIEAVRHGRCYVTDGPTMNFTIDGFIMGDTIYSDTSKTINIQITGNAIESSTVNIISNGGNIHSESVSAGPFSISHNHNADTDSYFRVEIRTNNGAIFPPRGENNIAFSNAIYFDLTPYEEPPSPPTNMEAWINRTDVVLNWTDSSSNDVMHYNIYRSTTVNGFDFTYPYALTNRTNYVDKGAGDGNTNNYFYIVRAVDKKLYNDTNTIVLGKYASQLNNGWNMVSTPFILSMDHPDNVLQTINDTCKLALHYDASDGANPWKDTRTGDLVNINNTMGLWLYLNASDYFITAGRVPTSTDIYLNEGWNLVGFPSFSNSSLDEALGGLNWVAVRFYDPWDMKNDHWKQNSTEKPSLTNDLHQMRTGCGYWIRVAEEATWSVTEG